MVHQMSQAPQFGITVFLILWFHQFNFVVQLSSLFGRTVVSTKVNKSKWLKPSMFSKVAVIYLKGVCDCS